MKNITKIKFERDMKELEEWEEMQEYEGFEITDNLINEIGIIKTTGNSFILKKGDRQVYVNDNKLYSPLLRATFDAIDRCIESAPTTEPISIIDVDLEVLEAHTQWIKEMMKIAQLIE